jgi:hypothetical protein
VDIADSSKPLEENNDVDVDDDSIDDDIIDGTDLSDSNVWTNEFDANSIFLPETVISEVSDEANNLSDLDGFLGFESDSLELDFDAFSEDSVVADVQPVKIIPTVTYHASMEYHENSSIEDLVYSSELG